MMHVIGLRGRAPRLILSASPEDAQRQVLDGEVHFEADVPPGRWVIDADGAGLIAYAPPLEERKRARWLEARDYRDLRASGGCATPSGRVDSDPESRGKISGGSTAAIASKAAGIAFSVDWTMEDNRVVTLDADAMIAMGMAVVQHVALCQQIGTGIRDRIAAATTMAELDAIDITEGYPNA